MLQTIAEAVGKADLQDPVVRATLIKLADSYILGTTTDMQKLAKEAPIEQLSGQALILRQGLEAKKVEQKIADDAKAAKELAEYKEKLKAAWENNMRRAIEDGKLNFKEHFEAGPDFRPRFNEGRSLSPYLVGLSKDWGSWSELMQKDNRLGGWEGLLKVLENITETPGYLDKAAASIAGRSFYDLGGKWIEDYKKEGKMTERNEHFRQIYLTEISGNALGILLGAIEYEGSNMNDQVRARILQRSLEVLGGGRAQKFLAGVELTPVQILTRTALGEYAKNPGSAASIPARLKSLGNIAVLADSSVAQRQEEVRVKEARRLADEERQRSELQTKLAGSEQHLAATYEEEQRILDSNAKGARIREITHDPKLEFYLVIHRMDKGESPTLDFAVAPQRLTETAQKITTLKGQLEVEQDPTKRRQLRDQLAAGEVDAGFLAELQKWVNTLNNPANKHVWRKTGFLGRVTEQTAQIQHKTFDNIPQYEGDKLWFHFETECPKAIKKLEEAGPANQGQPRKSLVQLQGEQAKQREEADIIKIGSEIRQTEKDLQSRQQEAKTSANDLAAKTQEATVNLARWFLASELRNQLNRENRLSYA